MPRPPTTRPPTTLLLIAALLAALALGACQGETDGASASASASEAKTSAAAQGSLEAEAQAATTPVAARPVAGAVVEARTLVLRDFTLTGVYVGHLLPRERVQLRSEIDGVAEQVRFDQGQTVAKGDLLANIGTGQMRVKRDRAKADLALAESIFARERGLHEKKLVPDSQLEQTRTRRELARLELELAEIELRKSQVRTPIAGTVKTRGVDPGEFLNKGQLIAEILGVSRVRALFNVPEREVRHLVPGGPVQVGFEALPDEHRAGVVRTVGLEADLKTRTFPVEVEVDNAQGRLRPGMLARVTVALEHFRRQVLIPRHAILEREGGRAVFVVRDGHAEERAVEIGAGADGEVQVLRGLAPGEQLVVTGQQKLTPGEPVEVRPTER